MKAFVFSFFAIVLSLSISTASDFSAWAVKDILSMQVRPDGLYNVICRDGSHEVKSADDIESGKVCEIAEPTATPTPVPTASPTPVPTPPLAKVDILFVVDDSGSMDYHQKNVAANIDKFLGNLTAFGKFDWHIGVVTTDMKDSDRRGKLFGFPTYVAPNSIDILPTLRKNLAPGINGDSVEMGFNPVLYSMNDYGAVTYNKGFYRSDANLAIIYITDAEEQTNLSVNQYLEILQNNKPGHKVLHYAALSLPGTSCSKDTTGVDPLKYLELIKVANGKLYDLCGDWGANLKDIATDIATQMNY